MCFSAAASPVHYLPRADVALSWLVPTAHASHCPYKGNANYFSITANGRIADNAVWSYRLAIDSCNDCRWQFVAEHKCIENLDRVWQKVIEVFGVRLFHGIGLEQIVGMSAQALLRIVKYVAMSPEPLKDAWRG
jgi:hypothetical protein